MSSTRLLRLEARDIATGRPYVERDDPEPPLHDRIATGVWRSAVMPLLRGSGLHQRRARALVALVDALGPAASACDDAELRVQARQLRA